MSSLSSPEQTLLSVCMPTYNFGAFIGQALESILGQIQPGVEVVVLDSGSTDQTEAILAALCKTHSCLRYVREDARQGIDRDLARVVQLARGDYCWLFSADDVMQTDALTRVLAALNDPHDVYLCMHSNESISMETIHVSHPVLSMSTPCSFQLVDTTDQLRYFRLAETTEAFFSFMGGLIVRKAAWDRVALDEQFVGTCWAHVARLFELTRNGLRVRFLALTLVRRRGENDSFAVHGVVRRYALAINGFHQLAIHFWGAGSPQAFHIRRALKAEFTTLAFWGAKAACAESPATESKTLLDELASRIYCDRSLANAMRRLAYRLMPGSLYGRLRVIRRLARNT